MFRVINCDFGDGALFRGGGGMLTKNLKLGKGFAERERQYVVLRSYLLGWQINL